MPWASSLVRSCRRYDEIELRALVLHTRISSAGSLGRRARAPESSVYTLYRDGKVMLYAWQALKQISDFFLPNSLSQVELPGLSREEI
jgi:hypothetical protein